MKTVAALTLAAAIGAQAANHAYPAAYPFSENPTEFNGIELPAIPTLDNYSQRPSQDATNAHTENGQYLTPKTDAEGDAGGYVYYYDLTHTITEADFEPIGRWANEPAMGDTPPEAIKGEGFAWCPNGHCEFLLKFSYGAPPYIPWGSWNCTGRDKFAATGYTGLVDGDSVCNADSCCAEWIGNYAFDNQWGKFEDDFTKLIAGAQCPEPPPEALYCSQTSGHTQTNCQELVIDPTTRAWTYHCYDVAWYYWITCETVQLAGLDIGLQVEPQAYYAKLNPTEHALIGAVLFAPDKVCIPLSFYVPATSTSSTSSGSVTPKEPEDSASSTVAVVAALAMAAMLL